MESITGTPRRQHQRQGLTLLELVIVMTILVALGGLVVTILPNVLRQTHTSTGVTSMSDLNKVFTLHHQMERGYPNYLDNLYDGTGLYTGLPGGGTGWLTTLSLDVDEADALNAAGLTKVFNLASDFDDATFECYGEGIVAPDLSAAADVDDSLTVAVLDDSQVGKLKGTAGEIYAVFGIGHATPLVGGMLQEAPVHFGDAEGSQPNRVYSRFAAVFRIGAWQDDDPLVDSGTDGIPDNDRDSIDTLPEAEFVTTVGLHEGGIALPHNAIQGFYGGHEH